MPGLYLIPDVASLVMFLLMLRAGLLPHPLVVGALCVTGIVLQFVFGEPTTLIWLAGLLINATLAVYLGVRLRIS